MLNTTLTQSFSPSENVIDYESIKYQVSLSDAPASNPGYLVCITSDDKERRLIIPYAPSERYLLALGDFIHASIPILQPERLGWSHFMISLERSKIEKDIKRFCYPPIEEDSFNMLARKEVSADHAYMGVVLKKTRRKDAPNRVVVNLYRNGKLCGALNSRELSKQLKDYPQTPTYKAERIEEVARTILRGIGWNEDNVEHMQGQDGRRTRSELLTHKYLYYKRTDVLFNKKGIEVYD